MSQIRIGVSCKINSAKDSDSAEEAARLYIFALQMRVLLLACLLCVVVWRINGDCKKKYTNGCSNFGMLKKFEPIFIDSCDSHDVCYDCGIRFGFTRRNCDEFFHRNLLTACRSTYSAGSTDRKKCDRHANLYKAGVRVFGWLVYTGKVRNMPEFCHPSDWVTSCIWYGSG